MNAKEIRAIYEVVLSEWLMTSHPLSFDEMTRILSSAAKAIPPMNQIYLPLEDLPLATVESLKNAGFHVDLLTCEFDVDRLLYSISF